MFYAVANVTKKLLQSFQVLEDHDMIATVIEIHHLEMMNIDYK